MRAGLPHLLAILFALVLTACGDLPTSSSPDAAPLLSGECVPNSDGVFVCPPIGNGTCDPYHYDCGPGDCIMSPSSGGETVQNCPIGGGTPVGPGSPPPPSGGGGGTSLPDTCQTGDPVLDSPAVRQMLNDLWRRSNPSAPQSQRLEQGGWIVQNPDGTFGTMPLTGITAQGPCEINGNFNPPPNAVAWVHTHPFQRGEEQAVCPPYHRLDPRTGQWVPVIGPDGRPVYQIYGNRPSDPDYDVLWRINHVRQGQNRVLLAGLIIDHDRTTVYTEDASAKPTPFPRCGY
jgi:hypothetical protein